MSRMWKPVRGRSFAGRWAAAVLALAVVVCLPQSASAQPKNDKELTPEEKKGYTLPYFFTALGVLAVASPLCWPSMRKWDVSLRDDE